jgi:uncharacterized membrane protein
MKTPIIFLLILTVPYFVVKALSAYTEYNLNPRVAAVIGLSLLFIFTGLGHFMITEQLVIMMPEWVPERVLIVHLSGLFEFALATGFLIHQTRRIAGWIAIVALILFSPLNIYAAVNHIPHSGNAWGPLYLLIRGPLPLIIIFWIYWFAIKRSKSADRHSN